MILKLSCFAYAYKYNRGFGIPQILIMITLFFNIHNANGDSTELLEHNIGNNFEFFEDMDGRYKIDDILDSGTVKFHKSGSEISKFRFSNSTYWLKIETAHIFIDEKEALIEFGNPLIEKIEVYFVNSSNEILTKEAGLKLPFKERDIRNRKIVFNIPPDFQNGVIYIKVTAGIIMTTPVTIYSYRGYFNKEFTRHLMLGISYGIIFLIIIYLIVLSILGSNRNYLLYSIYLLSWGLFIFIVNGTAFEYFWPNSPGWNYYSLPVIASAASIFLVNFSRNFLRMKKYSPGMNKVMKILIFIFAANIILSFIIQRNITLIIVNHLILITIFISIIVSIKCLKNKYLPARYYLGGAILLLINILVFDFRNMGILPFSPFVAHVYQITIVFETILFSIAIVYRFRLLQKENIRSQEEIRKHLNEIDELQVRIKNGLTKQNTGLDLTLDKQKLNEYLISPLTDREIEVLFKISEGKKNKEIASDLHVSVNTIKTHILKIYEKLEVSNRTEATKKAGELSMMNK